MKFLLFSLLLMCALAFPSTAQDTPKSLGYIFPDEWEEHRGTMMIFPAKHHYGRQAQGLRREFTAIATAIAKNEPVEVFCLERDQEACEALLGEVANITIHVGDFSIDWARDNAPMVLRNAEGELATAGFRNNGWGKKYPGWEKDGGTRDRIATAMGWPIFSSDYVLEGGAIEIAGGIGIVTESCVLHRNRTDWSKEQVEQELMDMLGLDRIIWIKSGLMPDPITDGHVDGLLKFVAPDTVLLHTTDYRKDPNFTICQEAKAVLLEQGLHVIELPLMDDIVHMNYYIGGGGKVAYVPICGDPEQDEPALAVIRELYDEVVPIVAIEMSKAGGGIHCYTQQIPK